MATKQAKATLSRHDETWGDGFRAAFTQAKRFFDSGIVTYRAVAERVSQIVPVTDSTVLRIGYVENIRESPAGTRQLAYLSLMALGYDPTEFDLTPQDRALRGMTDTELRKMLDPGMIPHT